MAFDRPDTQDELTSDVVVGEPTGDQPQHLGLPGRELTDAFLGKTRTEIAQGVPCASRGPGRQRSAARRPKRSRQLKARQRRVIARARRLKEVGGVLQQEASTGTTPSGSDPALGQQ